MLATSATPPPDAAHDIALVEDGKSITHNDKEVE